MCVALPGTAPVAEFLDDSSQLASVLPLIGGCLLLPIACSPRIAGANPLPGDRWLTPSSWLGAFGTGMAMDLDDEPNAAEEMFGPLFSSEVPEIIVFIALVSETANVTAEVTCGSHDCGDVCLSILFGSLIDFLRPLSFDDLSETLIRALPLSIGTIAGFFGIYRSLASDMALKRQLWTSGW